MINQQNAQPSQGWIATIKEMTLLLLIVFVIRTFGFGLYQVPTGSMETTMLVGERFFADKFSYLFTKPQRGDVISFNDPEFPYSSNKVVRLWQEYMGLPFWSVGPSNWTKRVIGIPGDHIQGKIEDGKPVVYRNGNKIDEPYLNAYPLLAIANNDKLEWRSYDMHKTDNEQPFYRIATENVLTPYHLSHEYWEIIEPEVTVLPNGRIVQNPAEPVLHKSYRASASTNRSADEYDVTLGDDEYWLMGDNRRGSKDSRFLGPINGRLIHGKIIFRIWSLDSSESWWIVDLIKHPIDFWSRMRWNRFFQSIV